MTPIHKNKLTIPLKRSKMLSACIPFAIMTLAGIYVGFVVDSEAAFFSKGSYSPGYVRFMFQAMAVLGAAMVAFALIVIPQSLRYLKVNEDGFTSNIWPFRKSRRWQECSEFEVVKYRYSAPPYYAAHTGYCVAFSIGKNSLPPSAKYGSVSPIDFRQLILDGGVIKNTTLDDAELADLMNKYREAALSRMASAQSPGAS